ncbi:MAG TPA: cupredoxin family copper-binding protein [Thermoanaerobaculia bacterium]|nr:cupredoxin family copper-binding protein [Thermoanaerobaculia bacterium]
MLLFVAMTLAPIPGGYSGPAGSQKESGQRVALVIEATSFMPASATVHVGDRVTWTNKDPFPHSVTSRDGSFDSKEIAPGASWTYRAQRKGTFAYICTLHPTMKGTLTVK